MLRRCKLSFVRHAIMAAGTVILFIEILYYTKLYKKRLWENREFVEVMGGTGLSSADFWVAQHAFLSRDSVIKLRENTCKIPILNPFASTMVNFFHPYNLTCDGKKIFYFRSHVENYQTAHLSRPMIIMFRELPKDLKCCYEPITFSKDFDYKQITSPPTPCNFITQNKTVVPSDSEYITVNCWHTTNVTVVQLQKMKPSHQELLFYVPKPSADLQLIKNDLIEKQQTRKEDLLNVIILGFDQVSRANFIRLFQKTFHYLRSDLDAIDLQGFNKVGDATLNNTLALLTGHNFPEIRNNPKWWKGNGFFDDCPWIWKNFSEMGYITAYADDYVTVFSDKFKGFKSSPTNYFMEPFIRWYSSPGAHRWNKFGNYNCIGNEKALGLIQDHARKFSTAMKHHPYFSFMWTTRTYESPAGYSGVADKSTLKTLKYFQDTGVLNRSLVIVTSDHGWRAGPIMMNPQARLENRLSFAFLLLPQWFKEKYPLAYANMQENQYRLTTPYDIHATLEDLLNPSTYLSSKLLKNRTMPMEKGSSLFLPVSKERTCAMAGIDEELCACDSYEPFAVDSPMAIQLANYAVKTINSWLTRFPSCKQFSFDQVISAEANISSSQIVSSIKIGEKQQFRIVFSTRSEKEVELFEVTILTDADYWQSGGSNKISMSKEVFRLDKAVKAKCIDVYALKTICVCKKPEKIIEKKISPI